MSKNMRFRRKEWLSVLLCTVATAVGVTLASPFILAIMLADGMGEGFENFSTYIKLYTLVGFILGILIGFCQKLTFYGQANRLNWWIRGSILGGFLGSLIVGKLFTHYGIFVTPVIFGITISVVQQFVLIKSLKKATVWGWLPVNIIAWTMAQVLFLAGIVAFQLNPVLTLLTVPFSGAIPGLITGIYLAWLLKNFKKE